MGCCCVFLVYICLFRVFGVVCFCLLVWWLLLVFVCVLFGGFVWLGVVFCAGSVVFCLFLTVFGGVRLVCICF